MDLRCLISLGFALMLLGPPALFAQAHGPHVHGAAILQVAIEGQTLALRLRSPLENLLGFEHAPRTEQQKKAVRHMADTLKNAETLFKPTAAAVCTSASAKLDSPVLAAAATSPRTKGSDKPAHGVHEEVHAELVAEYVFRCEHPDRLRNLEVRLFDAFRRLHRVDAEVAGPRGQKSVRLTPKQRLAAW